MSGFKRPMTTEEMAIARGNEWKARAERAEANFAKLEMERESWVETNKQLSKMGADLAATQARERELREASRALLESLGEYVRQSMYENPEWRSGVTAIKAALSAPQDTTALREFGLKVARYAHELDGPVLSAETIVDTVLKGTP